MKKFLIIMAVFYSCNNKIDNKHIESLAENFMKNTVIPQMKEPKPYEIVDAKVVVKTVADKIDEYRFTYDHLSFNRVDSLENKKHLDSIVKASRHPDSIISITINVAYKTKYKLGDVVTDSIKLGYDSKHDKIGYWPF